MGKQPLTASKYKAKSIRQTTLAHVILSVTNKKIELEETDPLN